MRLLKAIPCALLTLVCNTALAQFSITCNDPLTPLIHYGSTVVYTLQGYPASGNITDIQWQYQMVDPCTSNWSDVTDTGQSRNVTYTEGTVGAYQVLANVTVQQGYSKLVVPIVGAFRVVPPDDIELPAPPNNVKTALVNGPYAAFDFPVKCRGSVVGYLQGWPKEQLTEFWVLGGGIEMPPGIVGDPNLLYLNGNCIEDKKGGGIRTPFRQSLWLNLGIGQTYCTYKQQLFIKIPNNYCNTVETYPLKTIFTVTMKKADNQSFTITVGP